MQPLKANDRRNLPSHFEHLVAGEEDSYPCITLVYDLDEEHVRFLERVGRF